MTPEAQRIAIAEAHRWSEISLGHKNSEFAETLMGLKSPISWRRPIPDYLNDLNAMHEAEKVLTAEQEEIYHSILADMCSAVYAYRFAISATAAQRAEAFLKALDLWKPSSSAPQQMGDK